MIKGDKGRMPLSMLDKLYPSKRRSRTARIKRTKAVRRQKPKRPGTEGAVVNIATISDGWLIEREPKAANRNVHVVTVRGEWRRRATVPRMLYKA